MSRFKLTLAVIATFASFSAQAAYASTAAYTYDALGRLASVSYTGGPDDGVTITYTYDAAGNRTQMVVVNPHPVTIPVVVVPLLGFLVIPLP